MRSGMNRWHVHCLPIVLWCANKQTLLYSKVIFAALMDHFALFGVAQRDYTIWRILASLGLVACVVVIAKF